MPNAATTLTVPEIFVYKTVGDLDIAADVYFPAGKFRESPCPVFLYIHGGGWISGTRKDVNGPMVHELLQRGIIVTSIDYRLMPEVTFEEQLDDIRDAEIWARSDMSTKINELGFAIMPDKVLVGGSSAGAHLAMMVVRDLHCNRASRRMHADLVYSRTYGRPRRSPFWPSTDQPT